ncbi:hypothetical protein IAC76_02620 [Spirochaetes bacterium]|uniref:Lipoprotein n=1 Tax=Candidatus Scatousia excrementipullorum TaxID=2840936 RepID=A0A9D9DS12_9BACT|nr:hypothetical protein [Candidatus Scatousia excrementipullorum]
MKKILTTIIMLGAGLISPVFAVCSITGGACSVLDRPNLTEKYVPDNLQEMQRPDAFSPQYRQPYYDMLINTDNPETASQQQTQNYNSNCQFGVCLPGETTSGEVPEL